jgi:hypothetical protein
MPNVEIDENELAALRRYASVADKMQKHPEARKLVQQAALLADPDSVGPEPRIRQEFEERFSAFKEEVTKEREAREAKDREREERDATQRLEQRWLSGRAKAREAGYTDEGLTQLEAWMEKRGVADHDIAMPAFERENPPAEPIMTGGQHWNFANAEDRAAPDLKPLFEGNEDAFLGPAIARAIKEARGQ